MSYGLCPKCGAPVTMRDSGSDYCSEGCKYPSDWTIPIEEVVKKPEEPK